MCKRTVFIGGFGWSDSGYKNYLSQNHKLFVYFLAAKSIREIEYTDKKVCSKGMLSQICKSKVNKFLISLESTRNNYKYSVYLCFLLLQVEFSSKLIEQAVAHFSSLPGVGKKSALRYVLHLIKQDAQDITNFSDVLKALKQDLKFCKNCHTISDHDICDVCANPLRNQQVVCVVQDYRDVMAIENTGLYKGVYHVLGGLISPMEGIGPSNLTIDSLVAKVSQQEVKEIILALNATMEGETTSFFIFKKLAPYNLTLSAIARGIAVGDELEYTDEVTLGRSIVNRIPYNNSLAR